MGEFDKLLADLGEVQHRRAMMKASSVPPISPAEARQKLAAAMKEGAPALANRALRHRQRHPSGTNQLR
jgi:hypothetical protein